MSDDRLRKAYRFATVPEHLIRDKNLSDRAFRLWCLLDRYAGKDDAAFPSRETLRLDLDCSRASVDRAVAELVDGGWLSKRRREAGGVNEYTLLIAKAPAAKAKNQVTEGGVITHEDTPPVITHEDTPVITHEDTPSSPVTTPVITGAAQKEASLRKHQGNETSDDSLRSSSAPGDTAQQPLAGMPDDASSTRVIGEPTAAAEAAQAESIAADWWAYYTTRFGPITARGKARPYIVLRDNVIKPALNAGYGEREIKLALTGPGGDALPDPVPDVKQFQRALVSIRNRLDPPGARRRPSNVHVGDRSDPDYLAMKHALS